MKNAYLILSAVFGVFLWSAYGYAESSKEITDTFVLTSQIDGCDIDMKQHCMDVTPGENREVLCLVAHEDKLLDSCRLGLVESALAVELGVASLDYVGESCGSDRVKFCSDVKAGQGRLLNCFKSNHTQIQGACKKSLQDIGFWSAITEPNIVQ